MNTHTCMLCCSSGVEARNASPYRNPLPDNCTPFSAVSQPRYPHTTSVPRANTMSFVSRTAPGLSRAAAAPSSRSVALRAAGTQLGAATSARSYHQIDASSVGGIARSSGVIPFPIPGPMLDPHASRPEAAPAGAAVARSARWALASVRNALRWMSPL